ncbi:MAG: Protein translocase subunit SecD [Microgenomates group bacterium LiPW_31]|nr:MAG: Protein translocase subunit SecD [Microgenomates group bacterium LiPW_31]
MKYQRFLLWFILGLTLISAFIDLPTRPSIDFKFGRFHLFRDLEIKQGIDLAGGTHLVFQADMSKIASQDKDSAIEAVRNNIERRVNLFGLTEPLIQTSKIGEEYRLVVELAGVKDINQAIDLIGQTAQLDFRELAPEATTAATLADYQPTGLTGKDLARSQVEFDQNTGAPEVGLEFSDEGAKKFSEITGRNVGKPVAIFLDEFPITIPLVREQITTGKAVISGEFTLDEAKKMSIQLNAGALPVPIKIIEQRNIGATLGTESIQKSIQAGFVGLLMVVGFMAAYYGRLGVIADFALIIYGLVTLALYKLIPWKIGGYCRFCFNYLWFSHSGFI